ncbi:TetR/AcrR family transcriptional regulator [Siculibacillus lacustris]|uniref:TetR/AcrR family transcriptional regulator n=1 Tax=Siculibacillus lacustris TaxID=1549641 RepID=A0A4V2KTS1_9HYPH|nr:TetR/AcrR family transcriptional regulator [Siculibacillus lacustris]TBW38417.1 TetR/AcrR family transcriptional regulator [Siculibacillus lacustris]
MVARESIRPGGRSARVQASVHAAVRRLLEVQDRSELTIPQIAAAAGVTPSTIYRRWGDLADLLADVAVERLRPDCDPADTGSTRGDLEAWFAQYVDEMSSAPGRAMTRDVLAGTSGPRNAGQCVAFTRQQLQVICDRATGRGEAALDLDALVDHVVAPIVFRILFDEVPPSDAFWRSLLDRCLRAPVAA